MKMDKPMTLQTSVGICFKQSNYLAFRYCYLTQSQIHYTTQNEKELNFMYTYTGVPTPFSLLVNEL